MINARFQISVLIVALLLSLVPFFEFSEHEFNAVEAGGGDSGVGIECVQGPGNCGCDRGYSTCELWTWGSSSCAWGAGWWAHKYAAFAREFDNGKRRVGPLTPSGTECQISLPPSTCDTCG